MSNEGRFTIELEHLSNYEFNVKFDHEALSDMRVDEAPPLGELKGPNPSRMLAVAAANCLSASLLFCLNRADVPDSSAKTKVTCQMERNEKGRLRVGKMDVQIQLSQEMESAKKMKPCLKVFEDFCVVTASIRRGIDVDVEVVTEGGEVLHSTKG